MARNGAGVYDLPAGYEAVTGETILATQHNTPLEDLKADANAARPVVAGGTGAATAVGGIDNLSTKGADIASATTTDIGTATGVYVDITGTTTITGLGTKTAGVVRVLQFDDILTLTHNATSLILPDGVDITTAAGDVIVMVSEGSGNWRCVGRSRPVIPATQADMEAATSTIKFVTPGNMHHHPGHPKGWVFCGVAGNIAASYNVTSVTDNGVGDATVTWATDFSSANYGVAVSVAQNGANPRIPQVNSQNAGTTTVACFNPAASLVDPQTWTVIAVGDQA